MLFRSAQQGRTISLNIAVLPAFSRNPAPDPLFAFAGGPGMGSTELANLAESALRRVREKRDIVLIDQRGTGESGPLDCAIDDADSTLYQQDPIGWAIERLSACRDGYDADLRLYTTPIAMDDIDDVRQALAGSVTLSFSAMGVEVLRRSATASANGSARIGCSRYSSR